MSLTLRRLHVKRWMRLIAAGMLLTASACGEAPQARGSPGCGEPPGAAPERVTVAGSERPVIVVPPADYDPDTPHDLVIAFHGRTNPAARARRYYGLERHARRPTLFVYPSALPAGPGVFAWADPGDPAGSLRDYALFDALVASVTRQYCIDPGRIFAVGHSLGASFVNSLACARGHLLRGVASVAGGVSPSACRGEVAALVAHHPDDRLVAFDHGERVRNLYLAMNGLAPPAQPLTRLEPPSGFACERYGELAGNPLVWCPHQVDTTRSGRYYPHQWPPGTGAFIARFFAAVK